MKGEWYAPETADGLTSKTANKVADAVWGAMKPAQLDALGKGTATAPEYYTGHVTPGGGQVVWTSEAVDPYWPVHDANPLHVVDRVVGRTRQEVEERIAEMQAEDTLLRNYLLAKFKGNDLHGIEDSASDLRDLEAAMKALQWVLGENV